MNKILNYILLAPILGFFLININPNLVYSKNNSPSFKKVSCKINYKNNLSQKVILDVADTEDKRAFGLMYKTHMDNNRGMLFVWKDSQIRTFWMANTFLNLDLFFINDKWTITDIYRNAKAMDKTSIKSKEKVKFVLELQTGKSKANLGDRLICPII